MSVLVSSQDIYVSTQQSGSASSQGADDGFNRFRICMNSNPLTTGNNQYGRLSITQFSAYRNFFYVNNWNNKIWVTYTHAGVAKNKMIELDVGDYANIGEIAVNFTEKLIAMFAIAAPAGAGVTFTEKVATTPASGYVKGQKGTGIYGVELETSGAAHGITAIKIQCRQYLQTETAASVPVQGTYGFNDSYALLGGKRIGTQNASSESFTAVNGATDELVISGFFPLQRSTTQYLYMSCSENTSNMESQNISAAQPLSDTHIVSSSIIAKIPINDVLVGFQQDQSTPYFVELDNRHISEILFEIKDHHGRTVDMIQDITTSGNMFSDMVFNWEVYSRGGNPHELQAPVKAFNIEQNTMAVNVKSNTGSGF